MKFAMPTLDVDRSSSLWRTSWLRTTRLWNRREEFSCCAGFPWSEKKCLWTGCVGPGGLCEGFCGGLKKALSEATQVLRSETSAAQKPTYSLMQVVSDVGLRTTTDIQGFEVVTTVRRPAEKDISSPRTSLLS